MEGRDAVPVGTRMTNFGAATLVWAIGCMLIATIIHVVQTMWEWSWKQTIVDAIERRKPPPKYPPAGSLWLQSSSGMSWATEEYTTDETTPVFGMYRHHIWFRPGSIWLVLGSGPTTNPEYFFVDLMPAGGERPMRIMHNRAAMEHFSGEAYEMTRIDDLSDETRAAPTDIQG